MVLRALLAAVLVTFATAAAAADIDVLGVFQDWTAYRTSQGGDPVCYIASQPKKDEGKYTKRGKIYAMVSHRPAAGAFGIVSILAGYRYKDGSEVTAQIGSRRFTLFTRDDVAWVMGGDDDKMVKAMKRGKTMIVRGTSWRGTKTKDTYSLLGFTAALREIDRACKRK